MLGEIRCAELFVWSDDGKAGFIVAGQDANSLLASQNESHGETAPQAGARLTQKRGDG